MSDATYRCANCGGEFQIVEGWDAETEAQEIWRDLPAHDRAVICDVCFNEFMPWMRENHPEALK